MFSDGITCNFDGSPIYAPVIPDLPIASTWSKPASVNELIERVHPVETDGPLVEQMTRRRAETVSTWRRFFAGVEVTEEERRGIRATLEPWRNSLQEYQSPTYAWRKELARIKFYLDKEMEAYAWLDNDPRAVLAATPQNIGQALAARAGFEFKLKTLTAEIERNTDEINAGENGRRDWQLLWKLADAIVTAPAYFSDEFVYLLPDAVVKRIDAMRDYVARQAEEARLVESANRLQQISEREREEIERMAEVEQADFGELISIAFPHHIHLEVLQSFSRRTLTATHLHVLVDLKDGSDQVRRRAYERLIEFGESFGMAPPTFEEIEEAEAIKLREEEEAKDREIKARIEDMASWNYNRLCVEVNKLNLAPPDMIAFLQATDVEGVTRFRQYFVEIAPLQDDPLRRRVCELMIRHLSIRSGSSMAGATFVGI